MVLSGKKSGLEFDSIELVDRPWFPYLCTEVDHWEWKTAGDDHFNFWIALSGDGYLSTEGRTYRLKPGSFFVFFPHQSITATHYSGPRITRFSAHFFPRRHGLRLGSGELSPLTGEVADPAWIQRRIDVIMRLALRREDDTVLALHVHELIREVCGGGSALAGPGLSIRVSEALRRFRENPATVGTIEELARELGTSRSNFDREFTREVGQPPRQFLTNCKIIEARRYLESSHLRVGEIADALGYKDIYFFSRQFKQLVGLSPMRYRREWNLK